jgi:hypothetical protein
MKIIQVVATICGGLVIAFMFAGCSANDSSFLPGLPSLLSTGLPETCSEPAAFKPGSACAKDLAAAQSDPNFKIRDNKATRTYFDDACADDAAWQPGSTCHLLTDLMQRETGSSSSSLPPITFGPSTSRRSSSMSPISPSSMP